MEIQVNAADDFLKYVNKNWKYTKGYVNDTITIANNSFAWNINFKAFRTNDASATNSGCIQIPIGYLRVGDKVELECEIKNVSGVKGKMALDIFKDTTYSSNMSNVFILSSTSSDGQFEHIKATVINTVEGYGVADFGIFTEDTGDIYVRNVRVRTNTVDSTLSDSYYNDTTSMRVYDFGNFKLDSKYSPDICTLTYDSDGSTVILTHGKPFTGQYLGVAHGAIGGKDISAYNYDVKVFSETKTSLKFRFYNPNNGSLYKVSDLKALTNFWFNIVAFGYENNLYTDNSPMILKDGYYSYNFANYNASDFTTYPVNGYFITQQTDGVNINISNVANALYMCPSNLPKLKNFSAILTANIMTSNLIGLIIRNTTTVTNNTSTNELFTKVLISNNGYMIVEGYGNNYISGALPDGILVGEDTNIKITVQDSIINIFINNILLKNYTLKNAPVSGELAITSLDNSGNKNNIIKSLEIVSDEITV